MNKTKILLAQISVQIEHKKFIMKSGNSEKSIRSEYNRIAEAYGLSEHFTPGKSIPVRLEVLQQQDGFLTRRELYMNQGNIIPTHLLQESCNCGAALASECDQICVISGKALNEYEVKDLESENKDLNENDNSTN